MQKNTYGLESILDVNANNIWGVDEHELADLWIREMKEEGFSGSEDKLLNIIRLAFDVNHFNKDNEREAALYKEGDYVIIPRTDARKGSVAIRKKAIRRITDLSYENIKHISAAALLELIERNFGGGWDSISLAIRDIIESGFDVSTTTLPASRIRAKGGTLERKVNDGYDVLEIPKGTWMEAIFAKKKEPQEKLRFVAPEPEYDEDGNRRIIEDENASDDDDESNDETYYDSYTPEAEVKDVDEELSEE
ncbi:MAG: hypothetical protein NC388_02155 [Clostridium sp.]|nr:hypothetical protein [Clostridium sp.]